ncbi:MAG TPA: hypothetical protein VK135_04265 [Candidatus Dormibacteraeota bacterium]|nr:hypothetical protein [Candidatus Dormibacteraeota bacterium]
MYFLKRLFIYLMSILLIISLYKDLTKGISFSNNTKPKQMQQIYPKEQKGKLQAVAVRVQAGDTLLSVTEQFNQQTPELDIDQIIDDFKILNPTTDPFVLEPDSIYYFRIY